MADRKATDAGGEKTDQKVDRQEFSDKQRSSEGAPLARQTPAFQDPAPDVSNDRIDVASLSLDAADSTYHENPDPNPDNLRPAPGPSTVQVLGTPGGE